MLSVTKRALNGKSEILLRVNINHGQQVRLKSTLFINPENYDADQNKIKKGKPGSAIFMELHQLNKTLEALESHICDICIEEPHSSLTTEYLQGRVNTFLKPTQADDEEDSTKEEGSATKKRAGRPRKSSTEQQAQKEPTFFEALEHFIATRPASTWRKKRYEVLMRALQRFEMYRKIRRIKTYKLTLRGFNVDDINDFEKFLRSEEELYVKYPKIYEKHPCDTRKVRKKAKPLPKGDNTIINMFACLRYFFRDCIEQKLMDEQPFAKYKGNTTERYGTPYYITLEERDIICLLYTSPSPRD
mgnify:FL=1